MIYDLSSPAALVIPLSLTRSSRGWCSGLRSTVQWCAAEVEPAGVPSVPTLGATHLRLGRWTSTGSAWLGRRLHAPRL